MSTYQDDPFEEPGKPSADDIESILKTVDLNQHIERGNQQQRQPRAAAPSETSRPQSGSASRSAASAAAPAAPSSAKQNYFSPDERRAEKPALSGGIVEITVSDPEKKGENLNAYVTYKVNTKVTDADGRIQQSSVIRRYSDFAWLHQQLSEKYAGWLIPPIPEKAFMGRFTPMFVDGRRRGLELFINRVARHRELSKSPDFNLFLHDGQGFQDTKDGKVAPGDGKKAKGWVDMLSDMATSVSSSLGTAKEREKSPDDHIFEGMEAYAASLETNVGAVHTNTVALNTRSKEISKAFYDFGFACTLLGQYETEQDEEMTGSAINKLSQAADKISVMQVELMDSQVTHFQEPFQDLLLVISAVRDMFKARAASLGAYHESLSNLEAKQASLAKYQGKPGKEAKVSQLEREIVEAQGKVDESKAELNRITERVKSETARFRQEKEVNMRNACLDFVRMQLDHARKVHQAWESALKEIQALPSKD